MCKHTLKEALGDKVAPSIVLCRLDPWKESSHPGVGSSVAEGVQGEPQSKDVRAEGELSFSSGLSLRMWEPWLWMPRSFRNVARKSDL